MNNAKKMTQMFWGALFLSFFFSYAHSAPLPNSTREMVKKLKLDPSILADVSKELELPKGWTDRARKEGKLRILAAASLNPSEVEEFFRPFKERYPFIAIEYSRGSFENRVIKPLIAYRNNRIVADIITELGGGFFRFKEEGALEDLKSIPNLRNNIEGTVSPDGLSVGMNLRHWCMAYNTNLVNREILPKRWEDLLDNPAWGNGNLALGNRPHLWAMMLWKVKGERWIKNYLTRLFTELKPQLRKEGLSAMIGLTGAGEFHANIPAWEASAYETSLKGSPVSFHCPSPVPVAVTDMGVLKGTPNLYAVRVFINWFLSKEGQISQYAVAHSPPVHKSLQRKELLPYADEILGKERAVEDPELEVKVEAKLLEFWNTLWLKGSGR